MKLFTINEENAISVFSNMDDIRGSGELTVFSTEPEFLGLTNAMPSSRLVDLWNSIPGLVPVKKFTNKKIGAKRIWTAIQSLEPAAVDLEEEAPTAVVDVIPQKRGVKSEDAKADAPKLRENTKGFEVTALLKQPTGVTIEEIVKVTGWQKHTVRGFIAGAAKKRLGLDIESFKTANGQRAYRVIA